METFKEFQKYLDAYGVNVLTMYKEDRDIERFKNKFMEVLIIYLRVVKIKKLMKNND